MKEKKVSWILWPFWAIYQLTIWILKITGRLIGAILGVVFLIVGIVLSATIIGAIVGVPLIILGLMLMVRSIF